MRIGRGMPGKPLVSINSALNINIRAYYWLMRCEVSLICVVAPFEFRVENKGFKVQSLKFLPFGQRDGRGTTLNIEHHASNSNGQLKLRHYPHLSGGV
jgi:hypothetical protein